VAGRHHRAHAWLVAVSILARVGAYRAVPIAIPIRVPVFAALGLLLFTRLPNIPQITRRDSSVVADWHNGRARCVWGVPGSGPAYPVSLNTPVMGALKHTIYGVVTWGILVAIIVHVLSQWQLLAM